MPELAVTKETTSPPGPSFLSSAFLHSRGTRVLVSSFWYAYPKALFLAMPSTLRCLARSLANLSSLRFADSRSTIRALSVE